MSNSKAKTCRELKKDYRALKKEHAYLKLKEIADTSHTKHKIGKTYSSCRRRLIVTLIENYVQSSVLRIKDLEEIQAQMGTEIFTEKKESPGEVFLKVARKYEIGRLRNISSDLLVEKIIDKRIKVLTARNAQKRGTKKTPRTKQNRGIKPEPRFKDTRVLKTRLSQPKIEVSKVLLKLNAEILKSAENYITDLVNDLDGVADDLEVKFLAEKNRREINKIKQALSKSPSWGEFFLDAFIGFLLGPLLGTLIGSGLSKLGTRVKSGPLYKGRTGMRYRLPQSLKYPSLRNTTHKLLNIKVVQKGVSSTAATLIKATAERTTIGEKRANPEQTKLEDSILQNLHDFARAVNVGIGAHLNSLIINAIKEPDKFDTPRQILKDVIKTTKITTVRRNLKDWVKAFVKQYANLGLFSGQQVAKFTFTSKIGIGGIEYDVSYEDNLIDILKLFGILDTLPKWSLNSGAAYDHLKSIGQKQGVLKPIEDSHGLKSDFFLGYKGFISINVLYLELDTMIVPFLALTTEDEANWFEISIIDFFPSRIWEKEPLELGTGAVLLQIARDRYFQYYNKRDIAQFSWQRLKNLRVSGHWVLTEAAKDEKNALDQIEKKGYLIIPNPKTGK